MGKRPSAALALLLFAGCVAQPARLADTQWPQAVVAAPRAVLMDEVIAILVTAGATIENNTSALLQARFPDENAVMGKVLFGCGSCADPYISVTIVFAEIPGATQITAQYWRMIPQARGSEQRTELPAASDFNSWQNTLWSLRDKYAAPE